MQERPQHIEDRRRRIRFTKMLLRPLPRRATLHRYPILKWFAEAARRRPYLWTFRVSAMTPAFYAGSILSLLPIYGIQTPIAFALALLLRANLPTLIGLQMITNPLSLAPVYFLTYKIGHFLVRLLGQTEPASIIGQRAYSLVVGGLAAGLVLGAVLDVVYRFLAHEAQKHRWRMPHRGKAKESASPTAAGRKR